MSNRSIPPFKSRRLNRSIMACALAGCMLVGTTSALAQSTAATLRGQVSGDAADTTITVTNIATGYSRTVKANADGSYNAAGLPPGTYKVDVVSKGQASSKEVTLAVGQTATLDLGGGEQGSSTANATNLGAVKVKAAPTAMIETRTSENSTYISNAQIQRLPQATRNFLEVADTVPSVQFIRGSDGNTKMRSGATSADGTNVYIDGISQKNYVLTGGVSGQDSSRGNPFPQSAIGEYKVITSNYKAEYDQVSSAAIVASTKSGTNEFHGSFFWDTTNDSWRRESPLEKEAGQRDDFSETEWGATLSGPIIKDRAHFFIAYENKKYVTPATVIPGSIYSDRVSQLPQDLQSLVNTRSAPFNEDLYFGKIDWTIGDNSLFELTGKFRRETGIGDLGNTTTYDHSSRTGQEEKRANLRWQYTGTHFLNEFNLSYEDAFFTQDPLTSGSGYVLSYVPQAGQESTILSAGAGASLQNKGQKGWSLQDDFTLDSIEWHGSHTFKTGVKFKSVELDSTQINPANPQYYYNFYDQLRDVDIPYKVSWGSTDSGSVSSKNKQYGIYLQDDWEVNDHLTFNLGVRYDYEKSPAFLNFVTPSDVAGALQSWSNLDNANYNINNYISNGNNRKAFKNAWQPRLGFSYDLFGDQNHVIYGGAGRAYDRNLFDYLALEQLNNTFKTYTYYFTGGGNTQCLGSPCEAWNPAYATSEGLAGLAAKSANSGGGGGREIYLIDNNIKVPYSDQFSLGMRNTVHFWNNDWFTDVSLSRIESHDGFVFLRGNRRADGSYFAPGTISGSPTDSPNGYGAIVLGTNGVETRNNQLAMKIEKPYDKDSGWGMTLAYTYSDAKENRQFGEHYALDYPSMADYGWHQAAGIPKNRLVATGIYDLPWWDISLSGKLSLASQSPVYGNNCLAGNTQCAIQEFTPDKTFGYKEFSLALNKEIDTGTNIKMNMRVDVINVFNWVNYSTYNANTGTASDLNTAYASPTGLLASPMRTFKLTFGMNW